MISLVVWASLSAMYYYGWGTSSRRGQVSPDLLVREDSEL